MQEEDIRAIEQLADLTRDLERGSAIRHEMEGYIAGMVPDLIVEVRRLRAENEQLKAMLIGFGTRIADQHELLSKRAEKEAAP